MPKLIDIARQSGVKIGMALLDREFYSAQVFQDLIRKRISFVIPCRNESYVKQALKEFEPPTERKIVQTQIEHIREQRKSLLQESKSLENKLKRL